MSDLRENVTLRFWLRFWFRNSYDLWRTHPTRRKSNRLFATQRGIRAAYYGWRQGLHKSRIHGEASDV